MLQDERSLSSNPKQHKVNKMDQRNCRSIEEGNWIPMDKALLGALPQRRPYTLIEAAFSFQLDLSSDRIKSFRGYAKIWSWSLSKTVNFIKNTQSTKTETSKDTHNTVKFRFIKSLEKIKGHSDNKSYFVPENTPNKHNKENINTKHIRDTCKSILKCSGSSFQYEKAMSFKQYSHITIIEEKTRIAIDYYLKTYRTHRNKEHPNLKKNQWDAVIRNLFICFDEQGKCFDLSIDDLQRMMDCYFTTTFRTGCNYSIIHFNSNDIKLHRMNETGNMG